MFYYHYEALLDFRKTSDIMCEFFEIVRYKTQFYFATAATSIAVVARTLREITVLWRREKGNFPGSFLPARTKSTASSRQVSTLHST